MNKKYQGFVLYCDYDGTLTNAPDHFDTGNTEALRIWLQGGGLLGIASGRSWQKLQAVQPFVNTLCILQNGTQIYDPVHQIILKENYISAAFPEMMNDVLHQFPDIAAAAVTKSHIYWTGRKGPYENMPLEKDDILIDDRQLEQIKDRVRTVSLNGPGEGISRAVTYINSHWPEFKATSSYPGICEITNWNVSKGICLKEIREKYLLHTTVLATGDADNDLEMIQEADYGIAVQNASDPLTGAARLHLSGEKPVVREILDLISQGIIDRKEQHE